MLDGFHVDHGWAAAIGGALLRHGDPLGLALAAQVGLELGKDAEYVEERLAGSARGVHGLFGGSEMGALVLECRDNGLEITHRARQAVDARDHQRLAGMDEIEDGPELGTSRGATDPGSARTPWPGREGDTKKCGVGFMGLRWPPTIRNGIRRRHDQKTTQVPPPAQIGTAHFLVLPRTAGAACQ